MDEVGAADRGRASEVIVHRLVHLPARVTRRVRSGRAGAGRRDPGWITTLPIELPNCFAICEIPIMRKREK